MKIGSIDKYCHNCSFYSEVINKKQFFPCEKCGKTRRDSNCKYCRFYADTNNRKVSNSDLLQTTCKKCGKTLLSKWERCPNCGAVNPDFNACDKMEPVAAPSADRVDLSKSDNQVKCHKCGKTIDPEWKTCPYCCAELTPQKPPAASENMKCKCGYLLKPEWRKCPSCSADNPYYIEVPSVDNKTELTNEPEKKGSGFGKWIVTALAVFIIALIMSSSGDSDTASMGRAFVQSSGKSLTRAVITMLVPLIIGAISKVVSKNKK